jgi:hypothetical protein
MKTNLEHTLEVLTRKLLLKNNLNFIFKSNYFYLKEYFNYLLKLYNRDYIDGVVIHNFLSCFKEADDIKPTSIENHFNNVLEEYVNEYFNLDYLEYYENYTGGIYVIYNEYGSIIYIGKSINNLKTRSLQSFINKLPLGATSMKILPLDNDETTINNIEACYIAKNNPLGNQRKEKIDVDLYDALFLIRKTDDALKIIDKIFPTYHKELV